MTYAVILDFIFDVLAGQFNFGYILASLWIFLEFTAMGGILSLMPFVISMKKKSVPSAVVIIVVIGVLMQPVIGRDTEFIDIFIKLAVVTLIVLALTVYTIFCMI